MTAKPATPVEGRGAAPDAAPAVPLGGAGRILAVAAGVMILAMMVVTSIDVGGRYFFNRPLHGGYEITEILMGLVIFAGMPLATAAREHITVNFLESVLSRRRRQWQAAIGDLVCAVVAAIMAWRIFERGSGLVRVGETTLQLGIARGHIAWAMAVLLAIAAAVFVVAAILAARAAMDRSRA